MGNFYVKDATLANVLIGSYWVPTIVRDSMALGSAAYAEGLCLGGLQEMDTGVESVDVALQLVSLNVRGLTAGLGVDMFLFETEPTSSTFTDHVAAAIAAADLEALAVRASIAAQPNPYGASMVSTFDTLPRRMVRTDSAGKLYFAFVSQGAITLTAPTAAWRVEVRV